ncbi:MAG TPA: quinolinate synthase NadA [bacterium]|nr:quinolinate synthase NadA [bacterium]HEX67986.1 quinolinate synthase NadA [bacterium]
MKISEEIIKLKKERNAVILAHNYQSPEIQDIADFIGDSLELSRVASKVPQKVIVFCGVKFMAEIAYILAPEKTVLLPDITAGCPLAETVTPDDVRRKKEFYPGVPAVTYVNTNAEVKAESDYCCTSANAVEVVKKIPQKEILFFPDEHLGDHVKYKVREKEIHIWPGYCPVHMKILPEDIWREKEKHPQALVMVHPECRREVRKLADEVLSTGGMVKIARESPKKEFIVGTEVGILYRLKKENPEKSFYPANPSAICEDMKKITLEKVLNSLKTLSPTITLPEDIVKRAYKAIQRMVETLA